MRSRLYLSSINEPLTLSELTSPFAAIEPVRPEESDLTTNAGAGGEVIGQRVITQYYAPHGKDSQPLLMI